MYNRIMHSFLKYIFLLMLLLFLLSCWDHSDCENGTQKNGLKIAYYKNGKIKSETPTNNCLGHGIVKSFYKDGNIKMVGVMNKGKRINDWIIFDKKGFFSSIKNYEKKELVLFFNNTTKISYNINDRLLVKSNCGVVRKYLISGSDYESMYNLFFIKINHYYFAIVDRFSLILFDIHLNPIFDLRSHRNDIIFHLGKEWDFVLKDSTIVINTDDVKKSVLNFKID